MDFRRERYATRIRESISTGSNRVIQFIFGLRERCRLPCRDEGIGRRFVALTSIAYELIPEGKFVAEDIQAGDTIFALFIVPLALAALLATGDFTLGGNGAGELDAQI